MPSPSESVHHLFRAVVRREQEVPCEVLLALLLLAVGKDLHDGVVGESPKEQVPALLATLVG